MPIRPFLAGRAFNDAQHWRDRATEMRALADTTKDVDAAARMLRLADDYESSPIEPTFATTVACRQAEYKSPDHWRPGRSHHFGKNTHSSRFPGLESKRLNPLQ